MNGPCIVLRLEHCHYICIRDTVVVVPNSYYYYLPALVQSIIIVHSYADLQKHHNYTPNSPRNNTWYYSSSTRVDSKLLIG